VTSSTPAQPPGTFFHPTFMTLLIREHSENDSLTQKCTFWSCLQLTTAGLLNESYSGALQIPRWLIDWLIHVETSNPAWRSGHPPGPIPRHSFRYLSVKNPPEKFHRTNPTRAFPGLMQRIHPDISTWKIPTDANWERQTVGFINHVICQPPQHCNVDTRWNVQVCMWPQVQQV